MTSNCEPSTIDALLELAGQHLDAVRIDEAEQVCREGLTRFPGDPRLLETLARIMLRAGVPTIALAFVKQAVAGAPDDIGIRRLHAQALLTIGRPDQAEETVRAGLGVSPDDPLLHAALARALADQGHVLDGIGSMRTAIEHAPLTLDFHVALGGLLLRAGLVDDAMAAFEGASALDASSGIARSGLLFMRHYTSEASLDTIADEARRWGLDYSATDTIATNGRRNTADPDRRLRIGYLSGDFRFHPVGRAMQAVLPAHDQSAFDIYCYSNHWNTDGVTRELMANAQNWRRVYHLTDDALRELIQQDEIDILVDLAGHTANTRLSVTSSKPAPIQVMWLGYFDTTGVPTIDYILADEFVCPPESDQFFVESIYRLPWSFLCEAPPRLSPEVTPPPSADQGYLTFGCFNNAAKITTDVIAVWTAILQAAPTSRLLLKAFSFADPAVQRRFTDDFGAAGVDPDRIAFAGLTSFVDHLDAHRRVDIALDPFPYNGGMTTLDALWMGVPVITLKGERLVSRMGYSILSTLGLPDLVADSRDEYVQKAIALADDVDRLTALRSTLRDRMMLSTLCDGVTFTRGLEDAYRSMWRTWCSSPAGEGSTRVAISR